MLRFGLSLSALVLIVWLSGSAVPLVRGADAEAPAEVGKLVDQLKSGDAFVRLKAARALGALGAAARPAVPSLRALLNDPDEDVRTVARTAIQKIEAGPAPAQADAADIQKLIDQLSDKDAMVRLRAVRSLGDKGAAAKPAASALRKLLEDPDEDVRLVAARALKRIEGEKMADANGQDAGEPRPGDLEVVRTVSIFSKGWSDAAGLSSYPSRRFFVVTLRNNAKSPLRPAELKLSWVGPAGADSGDTETILGGPDLILPGAEESICCAVECTEPSRKWKIAVARVGTQPLADEEVAELQANQRLRKSLKVTGAKPIQNAMLGLHVGDTFTITNADNKTAKGVRVALLGYDTDGELVRVMVYFLPKAPSGDTVVDTSPGNFEKMERARKLAMLEHLADAAKEVSIARYEAQIIGVGVRGKE